MTYTKLKKEVLRFIDVWNSSQATTYGAAAAYYTVFSIAPLLLIAISVAGLVVQRAAVESQVIAQFQSAFGDNGAAFIRSLIAAQIPSGTNELLIVVGVVVTLIGATGVFSSLQSGLDAIFISLPRKRANSFWRAIFQKIYSLGMVLSLGFVLVVSLLVSALLAIFSQVIDQALPGGVVISSFVEFAVSLVFISGFLGCLIKLLPSERLAWKPALMGGLIAGVFFTIGKYLLALYLASSSIVSAYGAASSVIVLILWAYYLSLAFFLSAIITRLYFVRRK